MNRPEKIIRFIETLRLPDGTKAGQPFVLMDFQKELIHAVYTRDEFDERIVTTALASWPRKQGKSTLCGALLLAHLTGSEAIPFGQIYSMGFDRGQSSILFNLAKNMVYMDEELSSRINVVESQKKLIDKVSGSTYQALAAVSASHHGKSASALFFDELAQFGARDELYSVMKTSTGAHGKNALTWIISTQAPNDTALLSKLIDYGEGVRSGSIVDPTFHCSVYAAPNDADIWDENVWLACNPAMPEHRSIDEMREFAQKAKRMPDLQRRMKNLYLNQRIDTAEHFIEPIIWKKNGGPVDMSVFEDSVCYAGLDLSQKNDLSALVLVALDHDGFFHVLPFFWKPEENLQEHQDRDRVPYMAWRDSGFLEVVPGPVINYRWIVLKLQELHREYKINCVKFDRWKFNDLKPYLIEEGIPFGIQGDTERPLLSVGDGINFIPHGQGFKDLNGAVQAIEDLLSEAKVRHGMHPVLTMHASSVRTVIDPTGARKFDKVKSTGRIDGIVALAMALNQSIGMAEAQVSAYEGLTPEEIQSRMAF